MARFWEVDFQKTKLQCKITSVTLAQALLTREKSDPFAGLATWSGISLRDVNAKQAKHKPFFFLSQILASAIPKNNIEPKNAQCHISPSSSDYGKI